LGKLANGKARIEKLNCLRNKQLIAVSLSLGICLCSDRVFADQPSTTSTTVTTTTTTTTSVIAPGEVKVTTKDAHTSGSESQKVLDIVEKIARAYVAGDWKTVADYTDEGCTTFAEGSNRIVVGKDAVIADMKQKIERNFNLNDSPLIAYTIDQPYAKVTGDVAVVTFVAMKEYGGKDPRKMVSHTTEVFVKKDDRWMRIHYRSSFQRLAADTSLNSMPQK